MTPDTLGATRSKSSNAHEIGRREFLVTATTGLTLGFFLPAVTSSGQRPPPATPR